MSDSAIPIEDVVPVHEMSSEQATQALDKMKGAFLKENPPDMWTSGGEHSTAELKRMEKEAQKAIEDPVGAGLTGNLPSGVMVEFNGGEIASSKLNSMCNNLRELGLSDASIEQALLPDQHDEDPRWIAEAKQRLTVSLGDKEWVKSLLEGDRDKYRQLVLLQTILRTPGKAKA
jgi:hypothetical protein